MKKQLEWGYGYPYIPLYKLREWKKLARGMSISGTEQEAVERWVAYVRHEVDRLTIEYLKDQLHKAATYIGNEGYPCPLCTYKEDGIFVKSCSLHQQIEDLGGY